MSAVAVELPIPEEPDTSIKVGDKVRSYAFPYYSFEMTAGFYTEGLVTAIEKHDGVDRYKIQVTRFVQGGAEEPSQKEFIFPVINGIPLVGWGGKSKGVVKLPAGS